MARRRGHGSDEILMIPFLDILCSLIGVLVLIIVFLTVSQTSQTEGRTQEEVDRAILYKSLNQKKKMEDAAAEQAQPLLTKLATLEKETEEKKATAARLRKLVSEADASKLLSQNLLKELDNILLEITGFTQEAKTMKAQIAELAAEIKKRNLVANTPPPVIIQPAGAGTPTGTKNFFVEASGGKIVMYWNKEQQTQISSAPEVIIADTSYETFLKKVKELGGKLVFLIRDDGLGAYNNAAGWAQQTGEFAPSDIAKLPAPGRGKIDLSMFDQFLGTMPAPEGVPLLPPTPAP